MINVRGKYIAPSSLGGGIAGIAPKQTILNYKSSEDVTTRTVLRRAWNTTYATGQANGYNRVITPFRAVNNSGDFLSRPDYSCGGPQPNHRNKPGYRTGTIPMNCDGTNVPPSSCNVKFVPDSSDYIKFKKQRAVNLSYNDNKFGGDQSNASYVNRMAVHRS